MAWFIVRVELHNNASWADYDKLHAAMAAERFSRTITADGGAEYHLPTAEYFLDANLDLQQVCEKARRAATKTGKPYSVLVSQSNSLTWLNLKPVGRS